MRTAIIDITSKLYLNGKLVLGISQDDTSTRSSDLLITEQAIKDYVDSVAGGGSMVYPGAGIPVSTGSAWGTSIPDGTDGKVLTMVSGAAAWADAPIGLPSMTGNNGKFLTTNGTVASWTNIKAWGTSGNAGTDGGTSNFIGTTDNKDLYFKRNNVTQLYFDSNNIAQFKSDAIYGGVSGVKFSSGSGSPYIQSLGTPGLTFKTYDNVTWLVGKISPNFPINKLTIGQYDHFQFIYLSNNIAMLKGGGINGTASGHPYFDITQVANSAAVTGDIRIYPGNGGTGGYGNILMCHTGGKIGIGITTPTAIVHIKASPGSVGNTPLKLTSGTKVTTPEDGAFEYDGTHLYFTIGTTRNILI